ncbi:MAG: T9SS type A sorting domain-containing protein [Saprospiraceae bacterium]|nr:T9SS type A sorting domain-containing protein [Saprospiraceae bacterium]
MFYSVTGQLQKKVVSQGDQSIDISDLHQGVYIIKLTGQKLESEHSFKLIKL